MINRPVVVSPVKAILLMRLLVASGLPASMPKPLTMFRMPGGQQVFDQFDQHQKADRSLFGRLHHDAVAGRQRRCDLPCSHQDREVPRNDLADDAQRFVEMVGDRGFVDFGQRAFLGADAAGEIAEVVDGERDVGGQGFTDRLAVVPRFGDGQRFEVGFEAVGDAEQHRGALGDGCTRPAVAGPVGGVEGEFDVGSLGARYLAEHLAGDRCRIVEILTVDRGDPLSADEVVVAGLKVIFEPG
jgi:hypothetical protein